MERLNWPEFKAYVDAHFLSPQFIDIHGTYFIKAFNGPFEIDCQIQKTTPAGSDQTDFETNYKMTKCNQNLPQKSEALSEPMGFTFEGERTHIGTLTNETKTFDYTCAVDKYITGVIVKGFGTDWQDYVKFSVHIPAGHAMNPTTGTGNEIEVEADEFASKWAVCDTPQHIEVYKARIYQGFIIRVTYTTVSTTAVNFWVNTFLHHRDNNA